jgi:hypothetical protein
LFNGGALVFVLFFFWAAATLQESAKIKAAARTPIDRHAPGDFPSQVFIRPPT